MHPLAYIRRIVFNMTQVDFARVVGVTSMTISNWERNISQPTRVQMATIRTEALARKLPWDDRWFFQAPAPIGVPQPQPGAA